MPSLCSRGMQRTNLCSTVLVDLTVKCNSSVLKSKLFSASAIIDCWSLIFVGRWLSWRYLIMSEKNISLCWPLLKVSNANGRLYKWIVLLFNWSTISLMTIWCGISLCVFSWRSLLKVEVSRRMRGKCLSISTGCRSSMTWGMLLWVGGLTVAVLHVRSTLSCRLCICICFNAVSSSLYGSGALGWMVGNGAAGTACRLQCLRGNKVGRVSFMSLTILSSISAIWGVGCTVLFKGGRSRPLFLGAVWLRSIHGNAVDLLLAMIAGGSLWTLALGWGPLVVGSVLNILGIAIFWRVQLSVIPFQTMRRDETCHGPQWDSCNDLHGSLKSIWLLTSWINGGKTHYLWYVSLCNQTSHKLSSPSSAMC